MTLCTCGTEVCKLDGKLWQEHTRQRHFAALNGRRPRQRKARQPEAELTEAQVRAMLAERSAQMEREGRVGRG